MVNIGRPSTGCGVCKSRHIKCDETKPFCRRCQMIGRQCPGYPDPWESIFHDETHSTRQRTLGSRKSSPEKAAEKADDKADGMRSQTPQPKADAVVHTRLSLRLSAPSLEDAAVECMLHGWSKIATPAHRHGWLDLVVPIYAKHSASSSIRYAFNAVALCWFWKIAGLRQLAEPAYRTYARAIRSTYAAIADPTKVREDATLLSILMLASFESIDCSDSQGIGYRKHVEGAIRLVELRGNQQLVQEDSLRLFRSVRMCLVTQQLIKSQPVSCEGGFDWFPEAERSIDFTNEIVVLGGRVADLRARCSNLFGFGQDLAYEDVNALIVRAEQLLRDLAQWQDAVPANYQHNIVLSEREVFYNVLDRAVWDGLTNVYNDVFEACLAGQYHTLRIYIGAVLLRCRSWQMSYNTIEYDDFTTLNDFGMIQDSIDQICHIIPYSLEQMPDRNREMVKDPFELSDAARRYMYNMLTPIVTALSIEGVDETQREWMKGRLVVMSQKLGLDIIASLVKTPANAIFQTHNPYGSG